MPKAKNASKKVPVKTMASKMKKSGPSAKSKMSKSAAKSTDAMSQGGRKKARFHPGTVALREIKRYQKSSSMLLPRAPFQRLVREICGAIDNELRFQEQTLLALQEASEAYLVGLMEDSSLCAIHAKRQTVLKADMILAKRLRGDDNHDHVDRNEKTGDEMYYSLPYRNEKEGMEQLRAQLKNMSDK